MRAFLVHRTLQRDQKLGIALHNVFLPGPIGEYVPVACCGQGESRVSPWQMAFRESHRLAVSCEIPPHPRERASLAANSDSVAQGVRPHVEKLRRLKFLLLMRDAGYILSCLCLANCFEGPFLSLIALRESDEFHFRNASVAGNRSDRGSACNRKTANDFLEVLPRSTEYCSQGESLIN